MAGVDISSLKAASSKSRTIPKSTRISIWNREFHLVAPKFDNRQKELLYLELHAMISSGLDIRSSFEIVETLFKKASIKNIIVKIKEDIIKGDSISRAFEKTGYFTPYEFYSIQIGEETGKLEEVFKQLGLYFTKKIKQNRQFMHALSYPMLILFTSIGTIWFMLYFLVPMFSDIFKRFGGELPYITRVIISFSNHIQSFVFVYLFSLLVVIFIVLKIRNKEWFQKAYTSALIRIPFLGVVFKGIYLARFCSSMALLMYAHVPLVRSLQLVRQMIRFYPLQNSLKVVELDVLNGIALHESISKFSIFEPRIVALLKVGEEVNKVDDFFLKLSEYYSEEVELKTSLLNTFLEPFIIVFLGIVIGFILVAMYLPMFQISTTIGG